MPPPTPALTQLRRVRWAVRLTLTLGVAASITANILHAQPNPIAQTIAAWPPLALLLTVELISRVPVDRPLLATTRRAATTTIAAIAAWVSYWHMSAVAARYGETGPSQYLLPLSVDGLVIVASISLVELAGHIRTTTNHTAPTTTADPIPGPHTTRVATPRTATPTQRQPPPPAHRPVIRNTAALTRHPGPPPTNTPPADTPPAEPHAAIAYWHTKDPTLRPGDIATKVGRSRSTVRRVLAQLANTPPDPTPSSRTRPVPARPAADRAS